MFRDTVKELRLKKSWSQEELARRANLSNNHISRIEQGLNKSPNILTIKKIAKAFGMGLVELIGTEFDHQEK